MAGQIDTNKIIVLILDFLKLIMTETLAKRITSMVLIATGIPNSRVSELTGLCDRSVRSLRKALENGETENIFLVGGGGGKSKLSDVEAFIVEEIESGSYSNRQQIADMIQEKYGIKVSLNTVGKLVKKTASNG